MKRQKRLSRAKRQTLDNGFGVILLILTADLETNNTFRTLNCLNTLWKNMKVDSSYLHGERFFHRKVMSSYEHRNRQ